MNCYNLINARIVCGISDILSCTQIPQEDKEEIKALLFDLGKNIRKAQQSAKKVMDEYEAQERLIGDLDLTKTSVGPSLLTLYGCEVEVSINFTKKALRSLMTIIGIIFDKRKLPIFEGAYKKARLDLILRDLEKNLSSDSVLLDVFKKGAPWATKLSLYRDEDEHPKDLEPFVENYRIDATLNIIRPVLYDGTPLYEFLQYSSQMILIFSEALLATSLLEYIDENMFEIIEIPEQKRDPNFPKRFKVVPKDME